ncbi:MAG: hypothetical protein EKK47_08085 [Burkholderiales bacterium]|jgi:hypothetical protein|nr:MAG: hypothetical protein EKK47_08085 [Burkholderiales bacterium]
MNTLSLNHMTRLPPILLALLSAGLPWSAWPHGGEDHGDTPAVTAPAEQAPRAVAQTESFELVAVLDTHAKPPMLTLYLDKVDTNEPVSQASVDVEGGTVKAQATAREPGVYTVSADAWSKPGRYPLTISVQSAEGADLLDTTLVHQADDDAHDHPDAMASPRHWPWLALSILAAVAIVGLGWFIRQHARRRPLHKTGT